MKWLIASDLHGSARYGRQLLSRFEAERADRLLLLGDLLYHGPRNALPDGYDPPALAALLNERAGDIVCVRGNCDAEVDQMLLRFPVGPDYLMWELSGRPVWVTHGHLADGRRPPVREGDLLLQGHTHVAGCQIIDGTTVLNPGSVSLPKENSSRGYLTEEDGVFCWKDLDGMVTETRKLADLI